MPRSKAKSKIKRKLRKYAKYKNMGVPSSIPHQRITTHRYAEEFSLVSTAGSYATYTYNANDIYDPRVAIGGHSSFGYNEWGQLYNHWCVIGSKITVRCLTDGNSYGNACIYLGDDTATPYVSVIEWLEANKGTYKTLPFQRNQQTLTSKFSAKQFFNVKDVKDNVDRLGASVGASPTEKAVYHIGYQTLNAGTATMIGVVCIEYITLWSEPKDVAPS